MDNKEKQIKQKSKEYPAYSINQAVDFIEKFKFFPRNKPIAYSAAADVFGIKPSTKSFAYKVSAAKQYGLITTSAGTLKITELGNEFLFPTKTENELRKLKKECLENPTLYKELIDSYNGKPLPELRMLGNILVQSYGIIPTVSDKAAEIFIQSVNDVELITAGVLDFNGSDDMEFNKNENKIECGNETKENVTSYCTEDIQNDAAYESLVIPLGNQKNAILKFPSEITNKQSKFIVDMINLTFNQIYSNE